MRGKRNGFSVIEALISGALTATVLFLAASGMIAATRHHRRLAVSTELESRCLSSVELVCREVAESSLAQISCETDTLVFPAPRDLNGQLVFQTGSSDFLWSSITCYLFEPSSGTLIKKAAADPAPGGQPTDPLSLSPPMNRSYFQTNGTRIRVITTDVVLFQPAYAAQDGVDADTEPDLVVRDEAEFLRFTLGLEVQGARKHGVEVTMIAVPRNE